jgi:hypothetical protein
MAQLKGVYRLFETVAHTYLGLSRTNVEIIPIALRVSAQKKKAGLYLS